jgi:6,7-dimethyl-8-ribityllumazine synthase
MLKKVAIKPAAKQGGNYAIVASEFNAKYVDSMLKAARQVLSASGAEQIKVVRVPGAYEIPVVAARLSQSESQGYAAIICLGVVLRGETTHAQHIAESVSVTLALLQTRQLVPIINGVYLFENHGQAEVRCLDRKHNRGIELAQTAIAMAKVMKSLA